VTFSFLAQKIQDPLSFCSKQQEAWGLHSVSAIFFENAHITQGFFSEKTTLRFLFERTWTRLASPDKT
jgi:hypothetical protein